MLKEAGTSGQISLGNKHADQLLEVQTTENGSIVKHPVKAVPLAPPQPTVQEIDKYNAWAGQREPYSQRVRSWREQQAAAPGETTDASK